MDNSSSLLSGRISSYVTGTMCRGTIFFLEDLEPLGIEPLTLRTVLCRMTEEDCFIVKLARGVYCYPRVEENSMKVILPSEGEIAEALASRWHVRIAPCGAEAARFAGFTSLQTHPLTYLSDGSAQHFNLQNGRRIEFVRRKSVKIFAFKDDRLRNLVEGMRYLGKDNIGEAEMRVASATLRKVWEEKPTDLFHDIRLAPVWIRDILTFLMS